MIHSVTLPNIHWVNYSSPLEDDKNIGVEYLRISQ